MHILFVLMTVMASAYSLARLRQNRVPRKCEQQRAERSAGARADGHDRVADSRAEQPSANDRGRSGLSPFDALVYSFIALCALAVGFLALCPWDMLLAALTALVCALWAALLHRRRSASAPRKEPAFH